MSSAVQTPPPLPESLDEIVQRSQAIYSLPAVAAEVIQLTNNPKVDVRALKDCIEVDPALTAKILRVVNSSLFGLSREVSDLNQAIALLGTKPLKLLVLGFSLPEQLFSQVAREQLEWYWSTTLTRAVAAREISEQLWDRPGDDAFLAGLLQGIGVLVLLGQLQEPYASFLDRVVNQRLNLQQLEIESLGASHTALSTALLDHWNMPSLLVEAINALEDPQKLLRNKTDSGEIAKILRLAQLTAELVAEHRLGVLPELLEIGEQYCQLDKDQLHQLIAHLQPKVEQLADVLSLEFTCQNEYAAILAAAHEQMAILAETVAGPLSQLPEYEPASSAEILQDAAQLQQAVQDFLHTDAPNELPATNDRPSSAHSEQSTPATSLQQTTKSTPHAINSLDSKLTLAVGHCRSLRQPLSLLLLEFVAAKQLTDTHEQMVEQLLTAACQSVENPEVVLDDTTTYHRKLILPGCDRHLANQQAQNVLDSLAAALSKIELSTEFSLDAGIATVSLPSKNFPPNYLLETAQRCLSTAQLADANVVKSLEVY